MKKIALHWQILAALIAAIIYGVVFNTNYEVRDLSINRLKIEHVDAQVISQYEQLRGQT